MLFNLLPIWHEYFQLVEAAEEDAFAKVRSRTWSLSQIAKTFCVCLGFSSAATNAGQPANHGTVMVMWLQILKWLHGKLLPCVSRGWKRFRADTNPV